MKTKKIDTSQERKILINCIVSDKFLKEISGVLKPDLMKATYSRMLVNWILEYYQKFEEAPGKNIEDVYKQKSKSLREEEDSKTIWELIESLNDEYLNISKNVKYPVDSAVNYLKIRSLENLKDQLEAAIITDKAAEGEQIVANYKRVERGFGDAVSLLSNPNRIIQAFTEEEEKLFRFQGDLGKATGFFVRGDLISFMGASGRGKSWWLMHLAQLAMMNSLKVIYFNFEMSENQLIRRAWQNNVAKPKFDKDIVIPYFEKDDETWTIDYKEEFRKGVDVKKIDANQKKYRRIFKGGDVQIKSAPSHTMRPSDVRNVIDNFIHYNNYIPDVIVVDYADLMVPEVGYGEYRHRLNDVWMGLRRTAQQYNILVATATQSDRSSFSKDGKEENISEDIRKIQHVSKFLVINSNKEEREKGLCRIDQLKERDGAVFASQVVVLQCLDIGRPYLDSRFDKFVEYTDE